MSLTVISLGILVASNAQLANAFVTQTRRRSTASRIIAAVVVVVLALILGLVLCIMIRRRRRAQANFNAGNPVYAAPAAGGMFGNMFGGKGPLGHQQPSYGAQQQPSYGAPQHYPMQNQNSQYGPPQGPPPGQFAPPQGPPPNGAQGQFSPPAGPPPPPPAYSHPGKEDNTNAGKPEFVGGFRDGNV
ncbi:hypothetical protein C8J56DRAFT_969905 [Mycena floridula]|nr:hypothetical protein C8J56DRAFT_969905 [Mycena floridula]